MMVATTMIATIDGSNKKCPGFDILKLIASAGLISIQSS